MSLEIRQFNLVNSENETYTLTIANKYTGFLGETEGLGYEKSGEYQKIGNDYEQLTDNINQGVVSGIIHFFQPYAYQKFSQFARFCQDNNLTLYYQIPTGTFMRKGSVTKIEKSEGGDSLKVKIEFTAKSLWYQEVPQMGLKDADIIIIDYDPVTQMYTFGYSGLTVLSDTMIESPCHISLKLPAFAGRVSDNLDPIFFSGDLQWYQTADGVEVMRGKLLNISLYENDVLHIRTDTNPYQIYKINSGTGVKTDLYEKSDFSTKRFPLIQKGVNVFNIEPVQIGVDAPNFFKIEGRLLYETV